MNASTQHAARSTQICKLQAACCMLASDDEVAW